MSKVQLFAVTGAGPQALPVPDGATNVHELFLRLSIDVDLLGVYTSLCTFQHNKFLHLEDHFGRLEGSMAMLGWSYQLDRPVLRRALHQVCTAYPLPEARVRLDVLAGSAPELGTDCRLLVALSPFQPPPERLYQEGVTVVLQDRLYRRRPLVKEAVFVLQRQSFLTQRREKAYEYLLVDRQGCILEGSSSNFYAVRDGVLWTAGEGVLEGTARKIVLHLARELSIPIRLEAVSVEDIVGLDEAALSSASRAVVPIVNLAGQMIGDGRPGPITRRLLVAYRDYVAREIRPAVGKT